jgi:uncharacterized protein
VPWGVVDCIGVFLLTVVAVAVLAIALALLTATVDLPDQAQMLLYPLPLATLAAVTLGWVHIRHRALRRLTGRARARAGEWLIGVGLGVASFFAVNVVLGVLLQVIAGLTGVDLPQPQPQVREAAADPALLPWLFLSAVIVAPVAEELFFRGLLFQALAKHLGKWRAVILSAVAFAAAHVVAEASWAGGILVFLMVFPLGVFLAWLFERRGTLATPVAVHAAFNAATVGILLIAAGEGVLAT